MIPSASHIEAYFLLRVVLKYVKRWHSQVKYFIFNSSCLCGAQWHLLYKTTSSFLRDLWH